MIKFNEELFITHYKRNPPDYFHMQLRDFTITATRNKEAGARLIIGQYISHAVLLARREFGLDRLVFESEVEVEAVEVPRLGWLTGTLDFATAVVAGKGDVGLSPHVNDPDFIRA
jgi:hypothetical protein